MFYSPKSEIPAQVPSHGILLHIHLFVGIKLFGFLSKKDFSKALNSDLKIHSYTCTNIT